MARSLNPAKWSLGKKITSLVLVILSIPIFSISLLQEIEKTLVSGLKDNLTLSNRLIANQLKAKDAWFEQSLLPDSKNYLGKEFFVFPVTAKPNLDGFFDEWSDFVQHRQKFSNGQLSYSVLLGHHQDNFLVSIEVIDEVVVLPRLNNKGVFDNLEIEYKTEGERFQSLYLSTSGAGEFAVKTKHNNSLRADWRFKAFWLNTTKGYNIELRFPKGVKPSEIKFTLRDTNQREQSQYDAILSSTNFDLNPIVWPSQQFSNFFDSIQLKPAQRIWLLDKFGRVLAASGDLQTDDLQFSRNSFLNWILSNQSVIEKDPRKDLLQMDSKIIYGALKGEERAGIEYIKDSDNAIAVAATPILISEQLRGVLLLEENVARVQVLQKKALLKIFLLIVVVYVLVVWVIFWYVNRTVNRIKQLNNAIEDVVDEHGRMTSPLQLQTKDGDEIDDLYRAFANMGERLYDYNDYLEKLASRLSHELRTPIAIVRSSLDNLSLNAQTGEQAATIERAIEGNKRLGEIINRMRRASGVKQAMQSAEKESVDLVNLLKQTVIGFQASFPKHHFVFASSVSAHESLVSVDLFSEMFDKLISNAMDFSAEGDPISISLQLEKEQLAIKVSNLGPTISSKNIKRIFDSLVSIRNNQHASGANLGLGLHIVRLIADYHSFAVTAKNHDDGSGVCFTIKC